MGKRGATRVTAADIAKMGDLPSMIKKLIRQATEGDAEAKEAAATMLSSLIAKLGGRPSGRAGDSRDGGGRLADR